MALTPARTTHSPPSAADAAAPAPPRALHPSDVDWSALRQVYPESDGKPMADNTRQFRYIQTIVGGLEERFLDDPNVFVAGDFLWYPVEGHPEICQAPDAMVVFGRPKGDRGSYTQFIEGGIGPQVVFEVLSPNNTGPEMARKRAIYERYGVEEYYEYDPDRGQLRGWQRHGGQLVPIPEMRGWLSPRLSVRFDLEEGALVLLHPDGRRFVSYAELAVERAQAHEEAEHERQRAEHEKERAERERQRAERLAARWRALGIDPESA
jgi:Uma2 family endonuclease